MDLWTPEGVQDWQIARQLLEEYRDSLGVDLSFQDFDQEIAALPMHYRAPGELFLLASVDGALAGCCALRALPNIDEVKACEMKRLYVRPAFRGFGLGRAMVEMLIRRAYEARFCTLLLDTLGDMDAARGLYTSLGFVETDPYYHNPLPGARFFKADLESAALLS